MRTKRYEARDLPDALGQVKADLGPDAIVLSTRMLPRGQGLRGMFKRSRVEVTAAVEERPLANQCSPEPEPRRGPIPGVGAGPMHPHIQAVSPAGTGLGAKPHTPCVLPEDCWALYAALLDEGVEAGVAFRILARVAARRPVASGEEFDLYQALRGEMVRLLSTAGPLAVKPGAPRVVALVGPTGVGKTTTIAKLAAEYALRRRHRVMLVTLDTYRVAAVEQLRVYAKILRVPMAMARKVHDVQEVVRANPNAELFLIDTAGRNHRDTEHLRRLRELLEANEGVDVHLVLSSTTRRRDLDMIVQEYSGLPFDKVVLTKVDESTCFGEIFALLAESRLPVSYLTTGQRVPDDIEVASTDRIVDLVISPGRRDEARTGLPCGGVDRGATRA